MIYCSIDIVPSYKYCEGLNDCLVLRRNDHFVSFLLEFLYGTLVEHGHHIGYLYVIIWYRLLLIIILP